MALVVHRSMSTKNTYDGDYHDNSTNLPPWETAQAAQVPYMDGTSPALSNAEREALPSLWATRTNGTNITHHMDNPSTRYARGRKQTSFDSSGHGNPWGVKTPLTAPPPPEPYHTPIYIPPAPKSEPHPPAFVMRAPPTPPDSVSTTTASTFDSPPSQHAVAALPGTMAARNTQTRTPTRSRALPSVTESRKKRSRIRRWRLAFKEMFTYHPVDDSQFERIEDRHWTEEY